MVGSYPKLFTFQIVQVLFDILNYRIGIFSTDIPLGLTLSIDRFNRWLRVKYEEKVLLDLIERDPCFKIDITYCTSSRISSVTFVSVKCDLKHFVFK